MALEARVGIVTGAGRGIGRATALTLAAEGVAVGLMARSHAELEATAARIRETGGHCLVRTADVSSPHELSHAIGTLRRDLGPIDILVNNAGVSGPIGPIVDVEPGEWLAAIAVNLGGPLTAIRAVLPEMIERRSGRIVNVASGAGTVALANLSAYVTSKTALIRLAEILSAELAGTGVVTFAVEPGTVETALAHQILHSPVNRERLPWFPEIFARGANVPVERSARFIADLALGKADDLAGRFLSVHDDLDQVRRGLRGPESRTLRLAT